MLPLPGPANSSAVNLAGVTVLQCAQPAIFDAIVNSANVTPTCAAKPAADLVVVDERSWKPCGSNCAGLAWRYPLNSASCRAGASE